MTKLSARPDYEALDEHGSPYLRKARIIAELDASARRAAVNAALPVIARKLELSPVGALTMGLPVYTAFGLKPAQARRHSQAPLLLTTAIDLSLDLVPLYKAAEPEQTK